MLKAEIVNLERVKRNLKAQYPRVYAPAMAAAMNKVMTSSRAEGARAIKKETGIDMPIGKIKAEMVFSRAVRNRLEAHIITRDSPRGLIHFKPRPKAPVRHGMRRPKLGVSAAPWGVRKTFQGSFVGTARTSNQPQVFVRTGKARLPIKKLSGPGLARTMGGPVVSPEMLKVIDMRLVPVLRQEINFRAKR